MPVSSWGYQKWYLYSQRPVGNEVTDNSYSYPQVHGLSMSVSVLASHGLTREFCIKFATCCTILIIYFYAISWVSPPPAFSRLAFSLNTSMISLSITKPSTCSHELKTMAARVDLSDKECWCFDMVRLPFENARSTSTDVAIKHRR